MLRLRDVGRALLPFTLHGLARAVDQAVGLLLYTSLDLPGFVTQALGLIEPRAALVSAGAWTAAGAALWLAVAMLYARGRRERFAASLDATSRLFSPLYLRPALTLLALAALAVRPAYPYGFTLPVALTQDWTPAQDVAALAAVLAGLVGLRPARSRERERADAAASPRELAWAPRAREVCFMAFLVYALLSPASARRWDGHPGNEPKYLRMAVALGQRLSLDVDGLDRPMEEVVVEPLPASAGRALVRLLEQAQTLVHGLVRGEVGWGRSQVRAAPDSHLTVRGLDGGAYHVLAPGPSLLLAPALRLDRELNLAQGTPGRISATLLLWNALAAGLVAATFLLARDATGRSGLAAVVAGATGLLPPLLFYFHQFYPELPAALVLALALRALAFRSGEWARAPTLRWFGAGLALAALPWLHQKYLPVWAALCAAALAVAVDRLVAWRALVALLVPQACSLWLTALYNQALTGSPRPDALFLALGREGVTAERAGQGLLGLLLDARYGLLPYVPMLLLALAGAFSTGRAATRLRSLTPIAAVYYLTVALAENWTGSISSLGRFVLPLVPLAAAFAAAGLARVARGPGALALTLTLAGWSASIALLLWRDPHAANDCGALLAKSAFADGHVYLPNLLLRAWSDAAPGLWARLLAWALVAVALVAWSRRAAAGRSGHSPERTLAGLTTLVLVLAFALERWPSRRSFARFPDALRLSDGTTVFAVGAVEPAGAEGYQAGPGRIALVVRSPAPRSVLRLRTAQATRIEIDGAAPVISVPGGSIDLPLQALAALNGRRGAREWLARQALYLSAPARIAFEPSRTP